jgi:hypothetical protein
MADSPVQSGGMGGLDNINSTLNIGNQNFSAQLQALTAAIKSVFPRVQSINLGTFTMPAAATVTVSDATVTSSSWVFLAPTNASGAQLMGSAKNLYLSGRVAATSFSMATGNAAAAAGTETFTYLIVTF